MFRKNKQRLTQVLYETAKDLCLVSDEKYKMELEHAPREFDLNVLRLVNNFSGGKKYPSLQKMFNEQLESAESKDVFRNTYQNYRRHVMKNLENSNELSSNQPLVIDLEKNSAQFFWVECQWKNIPLTVSIRVKNELDILKFGSVPEYTVYSSSSEMFPTEAKHDRKWTNSKSLVVFDPSSRTTLFKIRQVFFGISSPLRL